MPVEILAGPVVAHGCAGIGVSSTRRSVTAKRVLLILLYQRRLCTRDVLAAGV
jgi:hypothetical protein